MGLPVAHVEVHRNREEPEEPSQRGGAREEERPESESGEGDGVESEENRVGELLEDQPLVDGLRPSPGENRQGDTDDRDGDGEPNALPVVRHPAYILSSVPKRSAISSVF